MLLLTLLQLYITSFVFYWQKNVNRVKLYKLVTRFANCRANVISMQRQVGLETQMHVVVKVNQKCVLNIEVNDLFFA